MLPQVNEYMKGLDYEYLIRRAFNYPYGHRLIGHWGNDTDKVRLKLEKALDKFIHNKSYNTVMKELMQLKISIANANDKDSLHGVVSKALQLTKLNNERL